MKTNKRTADRLLQFNSTPIDRGTAGYRLLNKNSTHRDRVTKNLKSYVWCLYLYTGKYQECEMHLAKEHTGQDALHRRRLAITTIIIHTQTILYQNILLTYMWLQRIALKFTVKSRFIAKLTCYWEETLKFLNMKPLCRTRLPKNGIKVLKNLSSIETHG